MDDVNDSYPPGTVVFWSLSTTPDGTAEISWFRKGFRNFDKVSVPGGCKCTVSSDGGVVAIAWTAGTDPISFAIVGPFIRELHAQEFAGRAGLMLEDPSAWLDERWDTNLGWRISKPVVTLDDATATAEHVYDSLTITKVVYAELKADAERYRQLAAGEIVDGHILINRANTQELARGGMVLLADSTYWNLTTESARLHQLLNGKDVDGKRLLPVSYVQSMARMESALGHVLGVIDDNLQHTDVDKLGFTLDRLD